LPSQFDAVIRKPATLEDIMGAMRTAVPRIPSERLSSEPALAPEAIPPASFAESRL
jgi:hypothetical protein